ncbi:hypothetical protein ABGF38_07240 [Helcococcus ovis]|uniref:hypothetical protein n=1 Tax=Helcococcus ovis TaxID=72026 RepID=UPI0038B76039
MELVLPQNYVEIEQEEMEYLDGGDKYTFYNNIKGAWNKSFNLRMTLRDMGWGNILSLVSLTAGLTYTYAVAKFGVPTVKIATILGGVIAGVIATIGVVAGVAYLWNNRVFY